MVRFPYPSTVDEQTVQLELDYPAAPQDLNRWLPLVKWLLAIPHYIVLGVLTIGAVFATIGAWFAILATDRYRPFSHRHGSYALYRVAPPQPSPPCPRRR